MSASPQADSESLSIDGLRRLQTSLTRRVARRDQDNILQVGFAPKRTDRSTSGQQASLPVTAQFDVLRKLLRVPDHRRIEPVESARLLNRSARSYQQLALQTDVLPTGSIVPTGVRVESDTDYATTSVVACWTKVTPVPPLDSIEQAQDPNWRWGVLCVAHLFAKEAATADSQVRVERQVTCGVGPKSVQGVVVARGRVPGGPDISLIETGLDRLWLSGLLPKPNSPSLQAATQEQLLHWVSTGTDGSFYGDGVTYPWRWQTFYPELQIASLGRLRHIVRYRLAELPTAPAKIERPFGPGSSGGVLVADGIPIGLQVAAMAPDFQVGFAQSFDLSLPWLQNRLRATALHIVHLLRESNG